MTPTDLDAASVAACDPTGQAAEILDLHSHLSDALWRVESAALTPTEARDGLVVAGMGGSGIGGRLARAAIGSRAQRPLTIVGGYALPAWVGPETMVLCASYSGTTEETLSCYQHALELGAQRIVAAAGGPLAERAREDGVPVIPLPGGFQPRAAVGYALVAALEVAAMCGAAPSLRGEVDAAATLARRLAAEWGPAAPEDALAKTLARRLFDTVPVIAGTELTAEIAYRWKTQINENAELPAFASALPELNHNEIVGWAAARSLARFAAIFLEDPDEHVRNARRIELTCRAAEQGAVVVERVRALGETRTERVVSLVLLGDLVSLYMAVLRGVDPGAIHAIDALKAGLADES
jgi:glucose/mannose-6-phosphate isomerase